MRNTAEMGPPFVEPVTDTIEMIFDEMVGAMPRFSTVIFDEMTDATVGMKPIFSCKLVQKRPFFKKKKTRTHA